MSADHPKHARTDHAVEEIVRRRWSPYAFADRDVDPAVLRSLFEAARWAASSYNEQPWRFLVARREDAAPFAALLSCLVAGNQLWARRAPVLAIGLACTCFARNGRANPAAQHDLGLATATLSLEATARGLAVHPMIGIVPERVRELYRLPEDVEPLTGLAIGYAGEASSLPEALRARDEAPRTRRALDTIVFGAAFGEPAEFVRAR